MGFEIRRVYNLKFEGEYEGLQVRTRSLSVERLLDATELAQAVDWDDEDGLTDEKRQRIRELFEVFAGALVDWNVEDDGKPVPADLSGILRLDLGQAMTVINAWMEAVASVSAPLDKNSNGGGNSEEALIPMEPLSPSLAN